MKIHTIAALTDFSTEAEHALDRAALLGAKHQAQLILVYGAESPDPRFANPQARLEQRARQIARRHSITVTTREYEGSVAERALQAAASADLLVVDRRMEREWTRFWQGPTLAHCLRNSSRTRGCTIASSVVRASPSANTRRRMAGRSSAPSASSTPAPNAATTSARPSLPTATASRAARSASATTMPSASKRRATSLLPEATPPVSPTT